MEEIDISQLLNYFKSKIIYIIFAMSIMFCLSSIYVNRFRVPEYTSSTTILLNKVNDNTAISSSDVQLNEKLVSTYGEIIRSKKVLRTVINNLSLDYEYEELFKQVSVSEVPETSIIKISVTDPDSELAAKVANEIATVFSHEIVEIYNIENISVIDEAEVSLEASSTSTIKIIGIATIAGAFIAVGIIFIIFYFDTTVKNEEDIERLTGYPVIGVVPISREKIKGSMHRKYYEEQAKKHKMQEILPVEREVRRIDVATNVDTEKEIGMLKTIPTVEEIKDATVVGEIPVVANKLEEALSVPEEETKDKEATVIKVESSKQKKKKYYANRKNNYYKKGKK